jgi:sugar O-acyltransferase (sialic acid O-acetyltransferase NeuD family)
MSNRVIVFGNTNVAELNYFYLTHDSPYEVVGFTVDGAFRGKDMLCGLPVVPFENIEKIYPPREHKMSLPLGFRDVNRFRAAKYAQAKAKGYQLISYVSSKSITWSDLEIGDSCFIFESAVVEPGVRIGNNVMIGQGSVVGHNSIIKDHCFLAPHTAIMGGVTVEPYSVLGANSTVRDGVTIARECIIGAGVTITKTTKEKGVYLGKPAELLPKPSDELGAILTWPVH